MGAIGALQEASEAYLVGLFEDTSLREGSEASALKAPPSPTSQHKSFFQEISRARKLLGRRNEVAVNANAHNFACKSLSHGNSRCDAASVACWVHLALRKERQPVSVRLQGISRRKVTVERSAMVGGGCQPAQRLSTSSVDGVRCVLPTTYITNTYPHTTL